MTRAKFEQIQFARCTLEPELAARALPRMRAPDSAEIAVIDECLDEAMISGDVEG